MKILYVEDNEDNVYVVRRRLTRAGFTILIATDREKALNAGCNDFDTKPIELPRLLEKIRALLPEQSSS